MCMVAPCGMCMKSCLVEGRCGCCDCVKGCITGSIMGIAMLIGGLCMGCVQCGRGICNTPQARRCRRREQVFVAGEWVDLNLCDTEQAVEAEDSDQDSPTSHRGAAAVADMEFYDLLRVPSTAKPAEIKKAYYREARACHPDKNPGNAEAKETFQRLADAYQVLSDPELRSRYDREGKNGVTGKSPKLDPTVFFSLLFDIDRLLPYTGELQFAMQLAQMTKLTERTDGLAPGALNDEGIDAAQKAVVRRQRRREVRCACVLRGKLDRLVNGRDREGFVDQTRREVSELASGPFAPDLLIALGKMYQLRARRHLAQFRAEDPASSRKAARAECCLKCGHGCSFYRSICSSLRHFNSIRRPARSLEQAAARAAAEGQPSGSGGNPEEEAARRQDEQKHVEALEKAVEAALPAFLETAWAAIVRDVDETVLPVTELLLKDKSVPWQVRIRRAEALQLFGQLFVEEGERAAKRNADRTKLSSEAAKALLQEALQGGMRVR